MTNKLIVHVWLLVYYEQKSFTKRNSQNGKAYNMYLVYTLHIRRLKLQTGDYRCFTSCIAVISFTSLKIYTSIRSHFIK